MYPSPFRIIKRMICFSRIELCFETQAKYIFSFLAYKTLRGLFDYCSQVFSYLLFLMGNIFLASLLYLFLTLFRMGIFGAAHR